MRGPSTPLPTKAIELDTAVLAVSGSPTPRSGETSCHTHDIDYSGTFIMARLETDYYRGCPLLGKIIVPWWCFIQSKVFFIQQ